MEQVNEFEYFGSILCKHGMGLERANHTRKVVGSLGRTMREEDSQ